VERPIVGNQRWPVGNGDSSEGVLPRARRDARIESVDGLAKALGEQDGVERFPFLAGLTGGDVGTVEDRVAQ